MPLKGIEFQRKTNFFLTNDIISQVYFFGISIFDTLSKRGLTSLIMSFVMLYTFNFSFFKL
jgi:hypothetical protein